MSATRELAAALASAACRARDAVLSSPLTAADAEILRREGGDDVFGADGRSEPVLIAALEELCGTRWPGHLIVEGQDRPVPIGRGGDWVYVADPLDGTRPFLAGKRSAWVLVGAGLGAATLEDLTVGAAVEVPTPRSRLSRVAFAASGSGVEAADEPVGGGGGRRAPVTLRPRSSPDLARSFVTVARFAPGSKASIGAWEDDLLAGLEVYEDPWLCSGGQLMGLASGADAAVLDPRPLFGIPMAAHPYDLAAVVVAREAGVVVESIPPGPLDVALDPHVGVAWAGYANEGIAAQMRARLLSRPASPGTRSTGAD